MKKINILLLVLIIVGSFYSCKDEDYSSKYNDPSQTSKVSCDALMTGIFKTGNTWLNPVYYRFYVQSTTSGRFSQIVGSSNSRGRYMGAGVGYYNTRWKDFYNMFTQYKLLETTYNSLSLTDQENYKPFLIIGRSVMQEQLDEMCTLFGGLPYSKAGTLFLTGDAEISKAPYDTAESIYQSILDDLDEANTYFATASNVSSYAKSLLIAQDYVNKGDVTLWRKFINSLRLRIAIRLSSNGSMTSIGRAAVAQMLNNPTNYPMVDDNAYNIKVAQDTDGFNFQKDLQNAIENGLYNRASSAILQALNVEPNGTYANADPRLPVLYDPNWDGLYFGLNPKDELSVQDSLLNDNTHGTARYYAAADTSTFTRNPGLAGLWMGAAEVSFSKAEAYAMGWTGAVNPTLAKQYFIQGMQQSTDYYYDLNSTGTYRNPIPEPDSSVILAYAESQWDPNNMQKCIITQKWLNFGILNELEAWNCVRRTGFPQLNFKQDPQTSAASKVPNRLQYATDEVNYNRENYDAFTNNGQDDTWYNLLFWMKSDWYTTIP